MLFYINCIKIASTFHKKIVRILLEIPRHDCMYVCAHAETEGHDTPLYTINGNFAAKD